MAVGLITEPVPSALINLYSTIGALAGSTALMLATSGYRPVASAADWLWIIAMGTLGGCGVLLLIIAYRLTKPSNLAPFDYFGILFAFDGQFSGCRLQLGLGHIRGKFWLHQCPRDEISGDPCHSP